MLVLRRTLGLLHAAFIFLAVRCACLLLFRFVEHIAHGLAIVAYAAFVAGLRSANIVLLSFLVPVCLMIYIGFFVVFHKKVFCSVTKSKPMDDLVGKPTCWPLHAIESIALIGNVSKTNKLLR
jgi:fatty acid desaturase